MQTETRDLFAIYKDLDQVAHIETPESDSSQTYLFIRLVHNQLGNYY